MIRNLTQELKFVKENSAVDRQEQDQRVEGLKMALAEVYHFSNFYVLFMCVCQLSKHSSYSSHHSILVVLAIIVY